MRPTILAFAALTLTPLSAVYAQATTEQAVPTADEQSAITRAEDRGRLIYAYDQAAWHSTDRMMKDIKDPFKAGVRGWVITPNGANLDVTYFGELDGEGRRPAIYIATMNGQKVIAKRIPKKDAPEYLSGTQLPMAAALEFSRSQKFATCGEASPNSVVLPPASDGSIDVYILSSQTKAGVYPFGGHSLMTIRADKKAIFRRKFTNSCLDLPEPPKNAVAMGVGHVMDSTPTEIHVWISLWSDRRMLVMTDKDKTVWLIDQGKVKLVTRNGMNDQEALKRALN